MCGNDCLFKCVGVSNVICRWILTLVSLSAAFGQTGYNDALVYEMLKEVVKPLEYHTPDNRRALERKLVLFVIWDILCHILDYQIFQYLCPIQLHLFCVHTSNYSRKIKLQNMRVEPASVGRALTNLDLRILALGIWELMT